MEYFEITKNDYEAFRALANDYYREGEDENTQQEIIDAFIYMMFQKVIGGEIKGCFARNNDINIGFALWAVDSEDFEFSEVPGLGTVLEIGVIPEYRLLGYGRALVSHIEDNLRGESVKQCYVSAFGPAEKFWTSRGYVKNGKIASNNLPIMVKDLV